ncbi:MAG TPA: mechanosensitive ion channel domain-containing protein [Candidatus Eisenbacteria bacterium]|jgi:small-conductance mechanosensitive channel|nr:mechanosensitive ion channel domain-containing protein [Candidatus Eisenbacteria bacterium]
MRRIHTVAALALVVLLGATGYAIFRTEPPPVRLPVAAGEASVANAAASPSQPTVDQTPLKTAQGLATLVTLPQERVHAQEALRLADHEVDIAFTAALRDVTQHPPPLSDEAKQIQARLQQAEKGLASDQAQVAQLTAAVAKASGEVKDSLEDQLEIANAQEELDQDEVDDAKQDLIRAGGDPQDRIQAMVKEHETSAKATEAALAAAPTSVDERGLIHKVTQWWPLHKKQLLLWRAKAETEALVVTLSAQHDALDQQLQVAKSKAGSNANGGALAPAARLAWHDNDASVVVQSTKDRAVLQKKLAGYDKRVDDQKELAGVYAQWIGVVAAKQRMLLNAVLKSVAIILLIALVGLFVDGWIAGLLARTKLDRRQLETMRSATRVTLQVLAVVLILLVVFGPPPNLGTFLGLAGAGLTVALKDFIVGFIGWFVLMGKNGIRLGDWVEINGVTGEVVELGMFHTVLLETGNWTDSGHPTGRRVTFTNGFAIEGHYFNFSTSGQWLWDEIQLVLPSGQDPYPIVDAIQKKVLETTSESAQQAEHEWQGQAKSRDLKSLSAAPAINVKPVIGGTQIDVRYITQAHERYQLRAKLNQSMVDLLGPKAPTAVPTTAAEVPVKA